MIGLIIWLVILFTWLLYETEFLSVRLPVGIDAHVRGWDTGARIICEHIDGRDRVKVYRTGGSNRLGGDLIAEWYEDSPAPMFFK